ncbi:MAG TPA: hypothetical protein VGF17_09500 [Phytomonospora sp.]
MRIPDIDTKAMRDLRARGEFFWLDLLDPSVSDLDILRDFDPLAHQDTIEFGRRAKLDDYPGSSLLVFYGVVNAIPGPEHDRAREEFRDVHDHFVLATGLTVFLPLTFLTGFFGRKFGWLVQQITPAWTFFVFGVALLVGSAAVVVVYLGRTGR